MRIKLGLVPLERGVRLLMVSAAAAVALCGQQMALWYFRCPALGVWRFSISRLER